MAFSWDRTEMENRAFVITIGVDKGEELPYKVTMSILDAEGFEDGEDARVLRDAEGECPASAMGAVGATISRSIYFGHTKAIILGAELLKNADALSKTVDVLSKNNDINIRTVVMATDKTAAEIMNAKPETQQMLGMYLSGFYSKSNTNTAALVVKADLESLVADFRLSGTSIIPKVTIDKDDEIKIGGVALIKNHALTGFLTPDDMAGYLWMRENAVGLQLTSDSATIKIERSKPKISFVEYSGTLLCYAKIEAVAGLEAGKNNPQVVEEFQRKIERDITETFRIFQEVYISDGLELREILRKHYPKLYDKYGGDWEKTFAHIRFVTKVDLEIRH
ncbi:MAG: Ger(x)C family spore germination protein [Defluviitaleaceae bacterium]|nr:Ger(x)C family spore germination protein [Defluviitaleaceae bacterium]